MLKAFRKYKLPILVVALAILTTSVGFSIDMHYCQGNLKNISFIGDAQTCSNKAAQMKPNHCAKKEMSCHKQAGSSDVLSHDGCCSNNSVSVQLEEDFLTASQIVVEHNQAQFLLAFVSSYLILESRYETSIPYKNYKPPLLDKDISVLTQTFLC